MNTQKRLNILQRAQAKMAWYFFLLLFFIIPILSFLSLMALRYQWLSAEILVVGSSLISLLLCLGLGWLIRVKLMTTETSSETALAQRYLELEDNLRKHKVELEQTNKDMESMAHSVSHDLRGSLRNIRGYTELLQEDYGKALDEDGLLYLSLITNTTTKVSALINDLVAFARLGKHEVQRTDVNMHALTEEVWHELNAKNTYNSKIKIQPLPLVRADEVMMRLVLFNIISNALKFTLKSPQSTIEVGAQENANEIIYYVKDDGAGFNMKYAHKLFTVFGRLHNVNEFDGTGVGLAIVKRVILKHEGKVWAEGAEEQGACFYFSLPKRQFK